MIYWSELCAESRERDGDDIGRVCQLTTVPGRPGNTAGPTRRTAKHGRGIPSCSLQRQPYQAPGRTRQESGNRILDTPWTRRSGVAMRRRRHRNLCNTALLLPRPGCKEHGAACRMARLTVYEQNTPWLITALPVLCKEDSWALRKTRVLQYNFTQQVRRDLWG